MKLPGSYKIVNGERFGVVDYTLIIFSQIDWSSA